MLIPDEPKQALRCRRILLAGVAYAVWVVLGYFLYAIGLLRIGAVDLAWYVLAIVASNALFFLLVRTGFNLRFQDPSMTFTQIAVSIFFAMWFVAVVEPRARGMTLLLFVSGLFFGVFRLRTREFLALALLALGLYAALIIWEAQMRVVTGRELQVEIARAVVLGAVLLWMAFMGGYVARLRADLRAAVRRIKLMAHTDHLTGAENRRAITEALRSAMAEASNAGTSLSLALFDIDHFKQVNDQYGHMVGDEVLREIVHRAEQSLRSSDLLARGSWPGALGRFGGEEFLLVFRGTELEGARRAAERIRRAVADEPFETEAGPVRVTVSLAVAEWQPGEGEIDFLRRTDRALYRAKEEGRNRVCVAPSDAEFPDKRES